MGAQNHPRENHFEFRDHPITLQQYRMNIQAQVLAFVECSCGFKTFVPTVYCPQCKRPRPQDTTWQKIEGSGKISSYCVIYVGPPELRDLIPYISVIVDFGEGLRITSLLLEPFDGQHPPEDLIGTEVVPNFLLREDDTRLLVMRKK